jgi:hypothetical protein
VNVLYKRGDGSFGLVQPPAGGRHLSAAPGRSAQPTRPGCGQSETRRARFDGFYLTVRLLGTPHLGLGFLRQPGLDGRSAAETAKLEVRKPQRASMGRTACRRRTPALRLATAPGAAPFGLALGVSPDW